MAFDAVIKVITGNAFWTKLSRPVENYNKDGQEWTLDVAIDDKTSKELKGYGLGSKVKNKGDERGDFITFKRSTVKRSGPKKGEDNKPITLVGPDGKTPWPSSTHIGNGSVVKVKFSLNETINPRTKEKGMRADPLAIQVYEHSEYTPPERQEFDGNPEAPLPNEVAADW